MFSSIEEALEDIRIGRVIIIVDDENRENEGDFFVAGEFATPENINFMATHGRGLICAPVTKEIANQFQLQMMETDSTDPLGTAFTVSIDHINSTTGISAFERSQTVIGLLDENGNKLSFKRPGHMFPLIAKENGVLERRGHTEAAVDLAKMIHSKQVGVICEIMNEDGTMARVPQLQELANRFDLKIITIKDLITYRKKNEQFVNKEITVQLPSEFGDFQMIGYSNSLDEKEHIVLVKGDIDTTKPVLVRIHSECLTGDVFGSNRCDCGPQLHQALSIIEEEGQGIIIYMRQEGRGIGLLNKLKSYQLQENGHDTVEANHILGFEDDLRDYTISAQIIKDLGINSINLLTNNPQKIQQLEEQGIHIDERIPLQTELKEENKYYLQTKLEKMGHILSY